MQETGSAAGELGGIDEDLDVLPGVIFRRRQHRVGRAADDGAAGSLAAQPEQLVAEAARLFRDLFGQGISGGRYGLASFMAFHPGADPVALRPKYEELCSLLASRFFPGREGAFAAAGLAGIGLRAGEVLVGDRAALGQLADQLGLFVEGVA